MGALDGKAAVRLDGIGAEVAVTGADKPAWGEVYALGSAGTGEEGAVAAKAPGLLWGEPQALGLPTGQGPGEGGGEKGHRQAVGMAA